jgi:transcriptional repressor NF-X1
LRSESLDEEPRRSVVAHRTSTTGIPSPTLAEALAATKKPVSATLSLGSLRKSLPEKRRENAIYLEGVLGYDEEMLSDILRPHMRGLKFTLTWVVSSALSLFLSSVS